MTQLSLERAIETARLLFVSRDPGFVRAIWSMGESSSWQLEIVGNVWEAMERVQSGVGPDLLLLDLPQGDPDGLHILRWLRRLRLGLPIILIGHPGDIRSPQDVFRLGARDYLVRPLDTRQLAAAIRSNLSRTRAAVEPDQPLDGVELIGKDTFFIGVSPAMRKLRAQAASLALANFPVLILGEGGSGKETTARLLHEFSLRSEFEFSKINCAALPGDLLEQELFGYEQVGTHKAARTSLGKFELCAKGTVLLDEVTEIPLSVQANLMRMLREKRFARPGSATAVEVDVRLIASSTRDIERAVSDRRFREDLYYLLSAYSIHVPPLRERREDILPLFVHFMNQYARESRLPVRDISRATVEACQAYSWPGNLREFQLFIKRYLGGEWETSLEEKRSTWAHLVSDAAPNHLEVSQRRLKSELPYRGPGIGPSSLRSLVQSVKSEAEKNAIVEALKKTGGNRKAAAHLLKVSYRTLLYKIEQYHLRSSGSATLSGRSGPNGAGGSD